MVWEKGSTRSTCSTSCISTIVVRRRPARHGARAEDSRDSHCSAHPLPRRAAGAPLAPTHQPTIQPTNSLVSRGHSSSGRASGCRPEGCELETRWPRHAIPRSTVALRRARGVSTHLAPEARLVVETPSARRMDRVMSTSPGATTGCAAHERTSVSLSCEGQGPASMPVACRGRVAAISPDCRSGAFGLRGFESRPRLFASQAHTPS
jgi:hypothetical protein